MSFLSRPRRNNKDAKRHHAALPLAKSSPRDVIRAGEARMQRSIRDYADMIGELGDRDGAS